MTKLKKTVCDLFISRVNKSPKHSAIGYIEKNNISSKSFKSYKETVESFSIALSSLGLDPFAKVSILSNTRAEWHFCDLAIMCSRAITIPIYPTYTTDEVKYILDHSEAEFIIVENETQLSKIISILKDLKNLKRVISIKFIRDELRTKIPPHIKYNTYEECLNLGQIEVQNNPDKFEYKIQSINPNDIATIVYTSGTTGDPKGALISHKALFQVLENVKSYSRNAFNSQDRLLTFLPLSHVFGRCESFFTILFGLETIYAESINKLMDNISIVKPTLMLGVPRIFEKIYENILKSLDENPVKKEIFNLAMASANQYFNKIDSDKSPNASEIIKYQLAKKVLFQKILDRFGGKVRFFISGGAPLSPDIIKFLRNIGLTILEGYGLTETVAPCTVNPMSKQVIGSVGHPIGDVEIKFLDDGEILIKSDAMFSGYYKNKEETEKVFTKDGWFKTGDIGEFSNDGFLKITDRKKDIIITSGGKNVAPQRIENYLKLSQYIDQALIIGDQKKYLTALLSIDRSNLRNIYKDFGIADNVDVETLSINPDINELLQKEIDLVNNQLASFETIKKFQILPIECTTDNYLTASLKLKKKLIHKDFKTLINAMYT